MFFTYFKYPFFIIFSFRSILVSVILYSFFLFTYAFAQEKETSSFNFVFKLGVSNTYLWRGIDYLEGIADKSVFTFRPTIHPSLKIDTDQGFYADIWTSFALKDRNSVLSGETLDTANFDEIDISLGYSCNIPYGEIDLGIMYYGYLEGYSVRDDGDGASSLLHGGSGPDLELYATYTLPVFLSPQAYLAVSEEGTFYTSISSMYKISVLKFANISFSGLLGVWLPSRSAKIESEISYLNRFWAHVDFFTEIKVTIYDGLVLYTNFVSTTRIFSDELSELVATTPIWVSAITVGASYTLGV